ncbi:MAG: hypothetical protein AMJ79_06060, partial [Phycisphaerae bacterium SM23_30]
GDWLYDPETYTSNSDFYDFMSSEFNDASGAGYRPEVLDEDGNVVEEAIIDNGLTVTFAIPNPDDPSGTEERNYGAYTSTRMAAQLENLFRLVGDGYIVAEMMYALESLNTDTHLYLVVDGQLVDADPTDANPNTPLAIAQAGRVLGYDGSTEVSLDFKELMGEVKGLLEEGERGEHSVGVRLVNMVTAPDVEGRFPAEPGEAELGDWVYVVEEEMAAYASGQWDAEGGITGSDGGLQISLQDGLFSNQSSITYTGSYEHEFTLHGEGSVSVELAFAIEGAGTLSGNDTLDLLVTIVDEADVIEEGEEVDPEEIQTEDIVYFLNELGDYQVESASVGGSDIEYMTITLSSGTAIETLPPETYKLRVSGVLIDRNPIEAKDSEGILKLDNINVITTEESFGADFNGSPQIQGWYYEDVDKEDPAGVDPNDTVDGYYDDNADRQDNTPLPNPETRVPPAPGENLESGGLVITLGSEVVVETDLRGSFLRDFEMGGAAEISFWFQCLTDGNIGEGETITLVVKIDGINVTSDTDPDELAAEDPRQEMEYISYTIPAPEVGGPTDPYPGMTLWNQGGWEQVTITLEDREEGDPEFDIRELWGLASGGHTIAIEAWLSSNRLYGEEFHFAEDNEDWSFSGDTSGVWNLDSGSEGVGDGGLLMTLGNEADEEMNLEGIYEHSVQVDASTGLSVEFSYNILRGSALQGGDVCSLLLYLYDSEDLVVGYRPIVLNTNQNLSWRSTGQIDLGDLEAGEQYTVQIVARLNHSQPFPGGKLEIRIDDVQFIGTTSGTAMVRLDDIFVLGNQEGAVRLDNFSVYQRVVPEEAGTFFDFIFDPLGQEWEYADVNDPGSYVNGVWDANGGEHVAGDGALVMTIGDGQTSLQDLAGRFMYDFTLEKAQYVDVDLSYLIGISGEDTSLTVLDVTATIESQSEPGTPLLTILTDQITTSGTAPNSGWLNLPATVDNMILLEAGSYTLAVEGRLSSSEAVPEILDELDDGDPVGGGDWSFTDVTGNTSYLYQSDIGRSGMIGDHALEIVLGDNEAGEATLRGELGYEITWDNEGEAVIKFDYEFQTRAGVDVDDILGLNVYLDDGVNPRWLIGSVPELVSPGRAESTGWLDPVVFDTSTVLGQLGAGDYTLIFEGVYTGYETGDKGLVHIDNVAVHRRGAGAGLGTVKLDDVELSLVHQTQFSFNSDPPTEWVYQDLRPFPDPNDQVGGYWDADAGPEGTGDGALVMTLGNGFTSMGEIRGRYEYEFTMIQDSFLDVELMYFLETGADTDPGETLDIIITIEEPAAPGVPVLTIHEDEVAASGGASHTYGWHSISLSGLGIMNPVTNVLSPLPGPQGEEAGVDYKLVVDVLLSASDVDAEETEAFDNGDPVGGGSWQFVQTNFITDYNYLIDGGSSGEPGDNALELVYGIGLAGSEEQKTALRYWFTWDSTDEMVIKYSYQFETNASIEADDSLILDVYLHDGETLWLLDTIDDMAAGAGPQAPDWVTGRAIFGIEPLTNPSVAEYLLIFEGRLNGYDVEDVAYIRIDDVEMHRLKDGISTMKLDNVKLDFPIGIGDWEYIPAGGDVGPDDAAEGSEGAYGGNDAVGPDPNPDDDVREGVYDFGACIHTSMAEVGRQSYIIEDMYQEEPGDLVVGFRYRLDSDDFRAMSIMVDGVPYNTESEVGPVDSRIIYGWWNYRGDNEDDRNTEYTCLWATAHDIPKGKHTIKIELDGTSETDELWLDNLTVLTTPLTNAIKPIATLLPKGAEGGKRHFAVGITNQAVNLKVYENETDIYTDGTVYSWEDEEFDDGYQTASIFELESEIEEWVPYGYDIDSTALIDFIGLEPFLGGRVDPRYELPNGEYMYRLEDLAIGGDAMLWAAMQRTEVDWINTNPADDSDNDRADIHPWVEVVPYRYWNADRTLLDIVVWRWDAFLNPADPDDVAEVWVDTGFSPGVTNDVYYQAQLVSSPWQMPIVAYTDSNELSDDGQVYAQRYEGDDTWGVMNTENVQNDNNWSSLSGYDMIIKPSGYPIVSYHMNHLWSDGIREFRPHFNLGYMSVTEESGVPNDDILDFGIVRDNPVIESFDILNEGPSDLAIHDILIGGTGRLPEGAFTLMHDDYPLVLEAGEQRKNISIIFDPAGVEPGRYTAAVVVHSSDPEKMPADNPRHPFGHFYELNMNVEVLSRADIDVEPLELKFGNVYIDEVSAGKKLVITNEGDDPLTINQWYFLDNNFSISQAVLTDVNGVNTLLGTINKKRASDDVTLAPNEFLTLQIVLAPDDLGFYNDVLHIASDDPDEPLVVAALSGRGISHAAIAVYENSGTANDDRLEMGRVIMGNQGEVTFTITNEGSTALTVYKVWEEDGNPEIDITPKLKNEVLEPGEIQLITVTYYPEPDDPEDPNYPPDVEDLETRIRISSNDPVWGEGRPYLVDLVGQAVPRVPIISVTETSGIANDNKLQYGTVQIGEMTYQTFAIQNVGGADLILKSFVINEWQTPYFVVPDITPAPDDFRTLAPDDSLSVYVYFNPQEAGIYSQTLLIRSNHLDQPANIYEIKLNGHAIDLELEVKDSQGDVGDNLIDFGILPVFQSAQHTITLINHGTDDLVVNWEELSDPDDVFEPDPGSATDFILSAGATEQITVTFLPDDSQSYMGSVWITCPTLGEEWLINLQGVGAEPGVGSITDDEMSTPHGMINFTAAQGEPLIAHYQTAEYSFSITNSGASDLIVEAIVITEPWQSLSIDQIANIEKRTAPFIMNIAGAKRLDPDNTFDDITLLPGSELTVPVLFSPQSKYEDAVWYVTILTNDPTGNNPILSYVELTGDSDYPLEVGKSATFSNTKQVFPVDGNYDNWVTVKLSGPGYALVVLKNGAASGSEIKRIELYDTTENSSLLVSSRQGTNLGQIVAGAMKQIVLKNVVVDGEGAVGEAIELSTLADKLIVAGLADGADISIDGIFHKGIKLDLGLVGDGSDVSVNGDIARFRASGYGDGTIEADSIKTFRINGGAFDGTVRVDEFINKVTLKGTSVGGSFIAQGDLNKISAARVTFSGAVRADNIGQAIFNNLQGADISVRNNLNSLKVKLNVEDSRILAGYDLGNDGRPGGSGEAADYLYPGGHLGSIVVNRTFSNSYVAAGVEPNDLGNFLDPTNNTATGTIGRVKFGYVENNNNGILFGVAAHSSIDKVLVGNTSINPSSGPVIDFDVMLI